MQHAANIALQNLIFPVNDFAFSCPSFPPAETPQPA